MNKRTIRAISCILAFALLTGSLSAPAGAESFFTARRTFGALFLGGSVVMAKKAIDFRRDANDLYDAYKAAQNAQDAERLFDRSSDRDTKSQMSIGISLVLLASGLRLLLASGVDDNIPKHDRRLRLKVESDARSKGVRVGVQKKF
ncbi:MAG: hypothetical protein QGI83_25105 [Candidatus Latescibacteria bacterium]|jgi:hypothetical protein|nr:hypothetical protein [Candidatus Latescibacterota bacterium]